MVWVTDDHLDHMVRPTATEKGIQPSETHTLEAQTAPERNFSYKSRPPSLEAGTPSDNGAEGEVVYSSAKFDDEDDDPYSTLVDLDLADDVIEGAGPTYVSRDTLNDDHVYMARTERTKLLRQGRDDMLQTDAHSLEVGGGNANQTDESQAGNIYSAATPGDDDTHTASTSGDNVYAIMNSKDDDSHRPLANLGKRDRRDADASATNSYRASTASVLSREKALSLYEAIQVNCQRMAALCAFCACTLAHSVALSSVL